MPALRFTKYEGLANDFIVVEGAEHWVTPQAAMRLCDRRQGIGADGVLTLLPSRAGSAAVRMHVQNADGSVAEMCGNGLRCVVRHHLAAHGGNHVRVDTDAGPLDGWLADDAVRVDMGAATLIEGRVEAPTDAGRFMGTAVSLGNPHLVLDPFAAGTDLRALAEAHGPALEQHPRFPGRVNVGFMSVEQGRVELVVFERGSGITQACGTGATAAAVVAVRQGLAPDAEVPVRLPGGLLRIRVDTDSIASVEPGAVLARATAQGDARRVFRGEVEVAAHDLRPATDQRE